MSKYCTESVTYAFLSEALGLLFAAFLLLSFTLLLRDSGLFSFFLSNLALELFLSTTLLLSDA